MAETEYEREDIRRKIIKYRQMLPLLDEWTARRVLSPIEDFELVLKQTKFS